VARRCPELPLSMLASQDEELLRRAAESGREVFPWVLTFDRMLDKTPFASDMREMLQVLEHAYGSPVEMEFTLNFLADGSYRINLLQCRPVTMRLDAPSAPLDRSKLGPDDVVMEARA